MKRNFPDFISAYFDYAKDAFCPEKFHTWTGISVLSAALERRVWIQRETFRLFPNIYTLLIARPGMGKSSAGNIGVNEFLRELTSEAGGINFLATQSSEASFIEQAARWKAFNSGGQEHTHASSFLYASEASNSLKEMVGGGVITPALTEFYDCPSHWKKELKSGPLNINNACCSILACCTFSYLKQLVPQSEAEGGFASRLLYIIEDEVVVRSPRWTTGGRNAEVREKLMSDLTRIYHLAGGFRPTADFIAAYEKWFPEQDAYVQAIKSERMQHFLARKHTNLLKLAMICSVSVSDDLILDVTHWERAMTLINEVELKLPKVVDHATGADTHKGMVYVIMKTLQDSGGILPRYEMLQKLMMQGMDMTKVEGVIVSLHTSRTVMTEILRPGELRYRLLADPNNYL